MQIEKGFTLIEILVVIAIVGLITSISFPTFSLIKSRSQATQCTSKLRGIGVGINLYIGENGFEFPKLASGRESREDTDTPVLETTLLDYVDSESVFRCPADHKLYEKTGSSYFWNSLISGQKIGNMNLMGIAKTESGIPIICDKENFHKNSGGKVNVLYADGHIMTKLQFDVRMD